MTPVLPGAAIGLLGGGANSRMLALAASRMGYRPHIFAPPGESALVNSVAYVTEAAYEDLDRVREFAASVEIVTVSESDVPVIALRAAANASQLRPSPRVFETLENGDISKVPDAADIAAEFCIVAARGSDGAFAPYPPISVDRFDGVLDIARIPAPIDSRTAKRATALVRDTLEDLDFVGIACVDFTLTHGHDLLMHETLPHPPKAGYMTMDACVTSQFEQHLRAVCGLPLACAEAMRPAAMAVLPEAVWADGEPDWAAALALPGLKLYLLGERRGYLVATAASATRAKQIVRAGRRILARHPVL